MTFIPCKATCVGGGTDPLYPQGIRPRISTIFYIHKGRNWRCSFGLGTERNYPKRVFIRECVSNRCHLMLEAKSMEKITRSSAKFLSRLGKPGFFFFFSSSTWFTPLSIIFVNNILLWSVWLVQTYRIKCSTIIFLLGKQSGHKNSSSLRKIEQDNADCTSSGANPGIRTVYTSPEKVKNMQ